MSTKRLVCPSCGFQNPLPLAGGRCVSCGARVDELRPFQSRRDEIEQRFRQTGFSAKWFAVSLGVCALLTAALLFALPAAVPVFDFEGCAGILVALPTWFLSGMLVGLISPGKTFAEPVLGTALVALPTTWILFSTQTVKTLPGFVYLMLAALGLLFSLVGAYTGERLQFGSLQRKRSS